MYNSIYLILSIESFALYRQKQLMEIEPTLNLQQSWGKTDATTMEEEPPIWGKLISLKQDQKTHLLRKTSIFIGRNADCDLVIPEKRLSGKHCTISKESTKIFVTDTSTNGTYIVGQKIGKNNKFQVTDLTDIWLLPPTRVPKTEAIGFKLLLQGTQNQRLLVPPQRNSWDNQSVSSHKSGQKQQEFVASFREQITCPFCCDIMIFPVAVQPCNHRLCGQCLTEVVLAGKTQCITCRKQMATAARDATINSLIDEYLKMHPEQQRDKDEGTNIFGHQPTDIQQIVLEQQKKEPQEKEEEEKKEEQEKKQGDEPREDKKEMEQQVQIHVWPDCSHLKLSQENEQEKINKKESKKQNKKESKKQGKGRRGRKKGISSVSSDISAETDSQPDIPFPLEPVCKQCSEMRNGYRCKANQAHTTCHNCSKPLPQRQEEGLKLTCKICNSYFCNLYMPPCQKNGPKLVVLGKRGDSAKIDLLYLRNNRVEMEAFRNLLVSEKKTVKNMFEEMMQLCSSGRFAYEVDRRVMRAPPVVEKKINLNKHSVVCDNCWRQLWFQMIFTFMKENNYLLPDSLKRRPVCYWGVNCRTMEHNIQHAKRYNHMEYQTRF